MAENKKIDVFCNLTKIDSVMAIDEKILQSSLVFDSLNPFPGYYHETPAVVPLPCFVETISS